MPDEPLELVVVGDDQDAVCTDGFCSVPESEPAERTSKE